MLIDSDGAKSGQINGLSVSEIGNFRFGRPARITARIGLGTGKVVDIEREVELGGPLHSKGVLILAGYLTAMFGADTPLSLSATLVFEQSYGGVDGDSASSARPSFTCCCPRSRKSRSSNPSRSPARSTSMARCRRSAA
jgi:predicted ATP-dependent protease